MDIQFYVGLDFHKNVSELCIQDRHGAVVDRARMKTQLVTTYLSNKKGCHIAIEASGAVFDMAEKLKRDGHRVTVIHAGKFRGIGIGGKKTDRRDAEALATALRLGFVPEVHQKSLGARRINSLLASRDLVVGIRIQLTNHVRGILREYGLPMPAGVSNFREHIDETLESLDCEAVREALRALVKTAKEVVEQEAFIEEKLRALTKDDERVARLEEVPGVGRLSACALVAAFDDISRFPSAKHAGSFLGLVPRESSSGNKRRLGSITKAGPELLRRYLIHGARCTLRYEGTDRTRRWAKKLESRVGPNKAAVALAHKNARICFALLRDGSRYGVWRKRGKAQAAQAQAAPQAAA
jgi:transposase